MTLGNYARFSRDLYARPESLPDPRDDARLCLQGSTLQPKVVITCNTFKTDFARGNQILPQLTPEREN